MKTCNKDTWVMFGNLPIGSIVWIQDSASGAYVELELQASLDDSVYLRVTGRQSKSLPESANYISSIRYNSSADNIQTKGGYEKSETASFLTSEYICNAICNFRS